MDSIDDFDTVCLYLGQQKLRYLSHHCFSWKNKVRFLNSSNVNVNGIQIAVFGRSTDVYSSKILKIANSLVSESKKADLFGTIHPIFAPEFENGKCKGVSASRFIPPTVLEYLLDWYFPDEDDEGFPLTFVDHTSGFLSGLGPCILRKIVYFATVHPKYERNNLSITVASMASSFLSDFAKEELDLKSYTETYETSGIYQLCNLTKSATFE